MNHNNLFEEANCQHFIQRINKLTPQSQAQWGKMNVSQMLNHCQKPFLIVDGSLNAKTNPIFKFLFGKSAKKEMLTKPEFRKSLPTFKEFQINDTKEFEREKAALIQSIETFKIKGETGILNKDHGLFGSMNTEEWNMLLSKHLDHHLKQFGV
jgi:hypothetical protein